MRQQLVEVFGELGISQYLDAFIEQGFDSWQTILDITESDLDALGVKLGHRRKLQRRIANSRGLAPDASLVSPTQPSIEDARPDAPRSTDAVPNGDSRGLPTLAPGNGIVAKRKYRRHPKPDENAPERPASAYVLFSNKMRDDLKGRNLTFTEIAKLVGENWQSLSQAEKEPFESQAQVAKEKFNHDMNEYKKTANYRKYAQYLQDFKAKHSQSQEKEASKRVKLSDSSIGSAEATPSGNTSDGLMDSEPPPTRRQRVGSTASTAESHYSSMATPALYHTASEDTAFSPVTTRHIERRSPERYSTSPRAVPPRDVRRGSTRVDEWSDDRQLPPLSDMIDRRVVKPMSVNFPPPLPGVGSYPYSRSFHSSTGHSSAGSPGPPDLVGGHSRPPSLSTENSSGGSASSGSIGGYPRTPVETSLPIHALLSGGEQHPQVHEASHSHSPLPYLNGHAMSTPDLKTPYVPALPGRSSLPTLTHGYPPSSRNVRHKTGAPITQVSAYTRSPAPMQTSSSPVPTKLPTGLDALLQAGEIVNRRAP